MSSAISGSGTKSGDVVGVAFREAVDGENFEWLKENWWSWKDRKDLLDYVIAKGADFTVRLFKRLRVQGSVYLLHSLIKGRRDD